MFHLCAAISQTYFSQNQKETQTRYIFHPTTHSRSLCTHFRFSSLRKRAYFHFGCKCGCPLIIYTRNYQHTSSATYQKSISPSAFDSSAAEICSSPSAAFSESSELTSGNKYEKENGKQFDNLLLTC